MCSKSFLESIVAAAFALMTPLYAHADSLNAKVGAWEITTTTAMTGMPVPAAELEKMPPQQRAALEAAMQAHMAQPKTHVTKSCITQEDLDKSRMLESDDDDHCTQKLVSSSAKKVVVERTCPPPDASTSQMTVEATTPESLVASIDMARGGTDGKAHVEMKGRWLGESCAGIDDD